MVSHCNGGIAFNRIVLHGSMVLISVVRTSIESETRLATTRHERVPWQSEVPEQSPWPECK